MRFRVPDFAASGGWTRYGGVRRPSPIQARRSWGGDAEAEEAAGVGGGEVGGVYDYDFAGGVVGAGGAPDHRPRAGGGVGGFDGVGERGVGDAREGQGKPGCRLGFDMDEL